jgi:hypothetical protein
MIVPSMELLVHDKVYSLCSIILFMIVVKLETKTTTKNIKGMEYNAKKYFGDGDG